MEDAKALINKGPNVLRFSIGEKDYVLPPGHRATLPIDNGYIAPLIARGVLAPVAEPAPAAETASTAEAPKTPAKK